ncbi:uncharacterized protein [Amphiura filiformis]|uniref:uncharacterized protein n=1 Tax=Amphiura filiformis TaxID=82378 RepID=UPI003B227B32
MAIICERFVVLLCRVTLMCLLHTLSSLYAHAERYYPGCVSKTGGKTLGGHGGRIPECIFQCPGYIKYVCGTDGVPYHNACFLCRAACTNPDLGIACEGNCPCNKQALPSSKDPSVTGTKTTFKKYEDGTEEVVTEELKDSSKTKTDKDTLTKTGKDKVETKTGADKAKEEAKKETQRTKGPKDRKKKTKGPKDKKKKTKGPKDKKKKTTNERHAEL